jgi:hypothetical protein
MPGTKDAWVSTSTLSSGSSYQTMLEFFGIPPYTEDRLDYNIAKKRRDWHAKTNVGNPEGQRRANQVVELIQRVSEALKRGADGDVGGGAEQEIPDEVFSTIAELWRVISECVFADDYDGALRVAREATSRWGMTPDAASVFAWVVATGFDSDNLAHPALLRDGLDAAELATREQPGEARNWESKISLLLAVDRVSDAVTAVDEAARSLPTLTARLHVNQARALIRVNRVEDAMVAAVRAVAAAQSDSFAVTAVRSQATALLVGWLAKNLLPLKSTVDLERYVELVGAAAWCSYGVPEAEDMVRVHRMWAANAGQRVFTGSWRLRSFLAVCTGFISLPVHNRVRSDPAWHVFLSGLDQAETSESFFIVASPKYVQRAHNIKLDGRLNDL